LSNDGQGSFFDGENVSGEEAGGDKLVDLENEKWTQDKVDKKMKELLAKRGTKVRRGAVLRLRGRLLTH
jgi:hypothetical protein